MKIKTKYFMLFALFGITLIACSANENTTTSINSSHSNISNISGISNTNMLPPAFTIENSKLAVAAYINDRLWTAPDRIFGTNDKSFEPHIGKDITMELRLYPGDTDKERLFVKTSIGDWMISLKLHDGIVYGDTQINETDSNWPVGHPEIITTFNLPIESPRAPNYTSSSQKNNILIAAETYLQNTVCDDLLNGEEGEMWIGANVYLANFHEYEETASAWIVRKDNFTRYIPIGFTKINGETTFQGIKGFHFDHIDDLDKNDINRHMFEQQTETAIIQFSCATSISN